MKTNDYENRFVAVRKAYDAVEGLDAVIEFLRANPRSSVKEIREALYSGAQDYMKQSIASHIASMLKTLRANKLVAVGTKQGEPIQIEIEEYVPSDENLPPFKIEVFDAQGNKYTIDNPYYKKHGYKYVEKKVKKWIIPEIRVYSLVA